MPKRFSPEFKSRAVRLVSDRMASEQTVSLTSVLREVAVNLGVGYETMRRWYRDPRLRQDLEQASLEAGVARLRRENAQLRQAGEILKAASAFSPKNSIPGTRNDCFHRRGSGQVWR